MDLKTLIDKVTQNIGKSEVVVAVRMDDGEWIFMPVAEISMEGEKVEIECNWENRA